MMGVTVLNYGGLSLLCAVMTSVTVLSYGGFTLLMHGVYYSVRLCQVLWC